ncbi:hypothetical protein [uncultured Cohaesibacter sp.]|uniref:hypothetical protein n=1 Tax=uncultured Cohaesibacter sp. TaxID=1002546 RepID=UPI002930E1F6|nr:hypothetical protein [uncultured Cohaesibacter sp.]
MIINEAQLRSQLTKAMAEAVDERETYDAYFGEAKPGVDYGVARADGVMPLDMQFMWEYAGYVVDYISNHGVDALDIAERAGNLFLAYEAFKGLKSDFADDEKQKLHNAVIETLHELSDLK